MSIKETKEDKTSVVFVTFIKWIKCYTLEQKLREIIYK